MSRGDWEWYVEHTPLGDYPHALLFDRNTPSPNFVGRQHWIARWLELDSRVYYQHHDQPH